MRGYVALLLLLAAIWGASFMFIKIAVDELAPTTTMALRLVFSAIPLLAIVLYMRGFGPATTEMRSIVRAAMILGVLSTALPFTLIAWGETKIDSGVAAIGNASMPIFVALLALRFRKSERATGSKAVGVVLGLIGVGVLAGVNPEGGWAGVAGTLAVIVASISYAVSTLYIQTLLDNVHNDVLAAASVTWGAIFLAPLGAAQAPLHVPSWGVIASVLALALLGTVAGQLLYFRLVYRYGSARASLVVYLLPVTALFYGALLLGEPITASAIVGLVLILTGTALGSGVLRMPRRRPAVVTSP
jgi:drug/metabolite transporter (DMT)-like permease